MYNKKSMTNINKLVFNYFLILFSAIPLSILIGSTISIINILIIDLSFIFLIIYKRQFNFLKNKVVIYLIFLYFYLIFNTFISIDYSMSITRNLGFLRIIVFFIAFNYFYHQNLFFEKMIKFWIIIILIVIFDVFIEKIFGKNILGYGELYGDRIVSFFKDEPIVGGYLNSFFLIIAGFFLNKKKYNGKLFFLLVIILLLTAIFLTGERSNYIKALLGIFILVFLYKGFNYKKKLLFTIFNLLLVIIILFNSSFLKTRYLNQIRTALSNDSIYFNLYRSGFEVFKNYKLFGVGNKNYRVETCKLENLTIGNKSLFKMKKGYICTTHPHQIYFEFLSEHGIIGTVILLYIFYKLIFSKIKTTINKNNYIQLGAFVYLLVVFLPVIPSGSFFNDYNLTLFAINLAIFYASDKNSNIFKILK